MELDVAELAAYCDDARAVLKARAGGGGPVSR